MKLLRLLFITICVTVIQNHAEPVKIACIGDSITAGYGLSNPALESYPARLQGLLGTNAIVRNYGVSGRTVMKSGDLPYWDDPFFQKSHDWLPDVVIIQLGTNDSRPRNWKYWTNFVSDFQSLIVSYRNLTSAPKLVICTPCPVYGNNAGGINPSIVTRSIAPDIRNLAWWMDLPLIDLHSRLAGHSEWFLDKVHPNSKGMLAMAAVMFEGLAGGESTEAPPAATIRQLSTAQIELSWPAHWGGLVPQSSISLNTTNSDWTLVDEAIPFRDGDWIRQTNTCDKTPQFFRLWQP